MSLLSVVNRLLPFATPGTPLLQDLVHLAVLCAALYLAPQIQEYFRQKNTNINDDEGTHDGYGEVLADEPSTAGDRNDVVADQAGSQDQAAFERETGPGGDRLNNDGFQNLERPQEPQQQQQQPEFQDDANDGEGGAGPARAANSSAQRNVGAKKAKSLARKDQRRAYHEFQRVQGDAQRAKDAEGAAEREAAQAAERDRRRAAEAKLEARKAQEREAKREQQKVEWEREMARRELAIGIVRRGLEERKMCNLFDVASQVGGDADEVWVEKLITASGLVGRSSDGMFTMVTSLGWIVRLGQEDMLRLYANLAEGSAGDGDGKIGFDEAGRQLEAILRNSR